MFQFKNRVVKSLIVMVPLTITLVYFNNCSGPLSSKYTYEESGLASMGTTAETRFAAAQKVITKNCAGCHALEADAPDFVFTNDQGFINAGLISPGNPDASKLIYRLKAYRGPTNSIRSMPDIGDITASEYLILKTWVSKMNGGGVPRERLGVRRLSRSEFNNTLADILEDSTSPATKFLPADAYEPYDNQIHTKIPSGPLIEGLEQMAMDVSSRFTADTTRRNRVLGCTATLANDTACITSAIRKLSTLLFRRPQSNEDITRWVSLARTQAIASQDFYQGVDFFLRIALMHPYFVYRFEIGRLQGRLDSYEVASRLSFMIWGTTPDQTLLDLAGQNALQTPAQIRARASSMLANSRALRRFQQFHAQWLGYEKIPHSTSMSNSMRAEADAILERVAFTEQRPWVDIFNMTDTRIDANIATIYNLPTVTTPTWRPFPAGRAGILSTGAYLSVAAKFGDTSPTQRGKFLRNRLLCQEIPPPPPSINVDEPPKPPDTGPNCKKTRYLAHQQSGTSCIGCHSQMDPIGFGLEQYDTMGRFRSFDRNPDGTNNTNCPIDGQGVVAEIGNFIGPAAMSSLIVTSGKMQPCIAEQYAQFAFGYNVKPSSPDVIDQYTQSLTAQGQGHFSDLVLSIVGSEMFMEP